MHEHCRSVTRRNVGMSQRRNARCGWRAERHMAAGVAALQGSKTVQPVRVRCVKKAHSDGSVKRWGWLAV